MKILPSEAGRILGITAAGVKEAERPGELQAERTLSGTRLNERADVEELARRRAERREVAAAPAA
jgi:hypothetical protein